MIVLDVEQNSPEWIAARLGNPTASNFKRILTPKAKKPAAGAETYLRELVCEWVMGRSTSEGLAELSPWIGRGKDLEHEAFNFYAFDRDAKPEKVGICFYGDAERDVMIGASPDAMIRADGLLEIKCPKPETHIGYLFDGIMPPEYVPQVQGQLWVTGREWCDFMSYCPGLPPHIVRVEPDPEWQDALSEHLPAFVDRIVKGRERLMEMGVDPLMAGLP